MKLETFLVLFLFFEMVYGECEEDNYDFEEWIDWAGALSKLFI